MIDQEVIHKVIKRKGKNGLMVIKVDLKKAYDRIECKFLDKAFKSGGFLEATRQVIGSCVSTTQYSILLT